MKSSTKFHFKVRKSYFKLRKAPFKRGLKWKDKNKNVLELDVEKDGGIFFRFLLSNKDYPFNKYN